MESNNEPVFEQEELKQRHGCVTAFLIIMIIVNSIVALMYFLFNNFISQNSPNHASPETLYLLGIGSVLNVFCALLLIKWKKWGFWGYIITALFAFIINICIGHGFLQSLSGLIGLVVLFGVLQIKKKEVSAWDNME